MFLVYLRTSSVRPRPPSSYGITTTTDRRRRRRSTEQYVCPPLIVCRSYLLYLSLNHRSGGDYYDAIHNKNKKKSRGSISILVLLELEPLGLGGISGRGTPPTSLNAYRARLFPLATLDEEAELLFSDTLHTTRPSHRIRPRTIHKYTVNSQQTTTKPHNSNRTHSPTTHDTPNGSRKRDQLKTNTGDRRKRPVGFSVLSGNQNVQVQKSSDD
eukprot:scaffold9342_cov126-Isochrysis_galbana.AAC.14